MAFGQISAVVEGWAFAQDGKESLGWAKVLGSVILNPRAG